MAMKSGCKMYTQKCYVTLEWPLVTFQTYDVLPTICAMCPQKIIMRAKVPLKYNFANKSALFPQAAPCPFSILGRTLVYSFYPRAIRIWNTIPKEITEIKQPESFQAVISKLPFTTPIHLKCL